jgi:voltage-gated potassium channel
MDYTKKYLEKIKPPLKKPYVPFFILITVVIIGIMGYYYLWYDQYSPDFVDVLYMTIITLTTVGFHEIYPLDDTGRLFTIFISVIGIASLFYVFTTLMEDLFILQLHQYRKKKKMIKEIDKLSNHIIVVGFGRVGQLVARDLYETTHEFVVIDNDFAEDDVFDLKKKIYTIMGDATADETLILAGVKRAKTMIIATSNPATTVFVTLSAKVLNPDIFIVTRSDDYTEIDKLKRAGADRVVHPYAIGGQRLVALAINPNVVDFFATSFLKKTNIEIETLALNEKSKWCGKTLMELDIRKKTGATILAIVRDKKTILNPEPTLEMLAGDHIIAFGTEENIKKLEKMMF